MSERYEIVDPRPIAAAAKYTYFLPTADQLNAIGAGDLVQVTVRATPPSEEWDSERVWVRVESTDPDWIEGTLESEPADMPLLPRGSKIHAPRTHIINVLFENPDREAAIKSEQRREFWERCVVDQAVLDGERLVHYIYREPPNRTREGDMFHDSGWRIMGDLRNASEEDIEERKFAYVALGAVLNRDDLWIQFIDEPVGSAYERDFERDVFLPARIDDC